MSTVAEAQVEELFVRLESRLGRYLEQMVRDRTTAEDLLQDTFHDAFRSRDDLVSVENPDAWLFGIARNRALHALRRRRRGRAALQRLRPRAPAEAGAPDERELLDLLARELNPEDRALVLLRYVHGFRAPELAAMTGRSTGSVRKRLSRARAKLVAAVVASALVLAVAGLALGAAGEGPFAGLLAADRPRVAADAVDHYDVIAGSAADAARAAGGVDQIGGHLFDDSRLLGTLPNGRGLFVIPTAKGRLCVLVEDLSESCAYPLTMAQPITFTVADSDRTGGGEGPLAYGVARDGVTSVSFSVGDRRVTVPVERNMFAFQGRRGDRGFADVVVTFADGTTKALD